MSPTALVVCLGGVATVDGGLGLREVVRDLAVPTRAPCDIRNPLVDAACVFARQKGATARQAELLEARLLDLEELRPYSQLPGAGAAGGLGAALAALGAELVAGAPYVLELVGFDERARTADLVVTAEGIVDATTLTGKAPGAVVARCAALGTPVAVFGGRVEQELPGADIYALSGDVRRAREDLVALGRLLAG